MTPIKGMKHLLAALLFASASTALAQAWPAKNVTMIVPWPAGGPSDISARPLAKGLQDILGKTFVIENKPGAGGNIGADMAAKSAPDGYTLLLSSSGPIVINPYIYRKMPYDPKKDLAPVTNVLRVPLVLTVHPSVPVTNLKELLAHIKAQGGKFTWASAGNGTAQHMTGELFRTAAALDMVHVPYKGTAPAITDLLGGHVPMMFDSTVAIVPHIKSGKVRAIAVSGTRRSPQLPDVPTFAEAGLPGVEAYTWYGLFAPGGTPRDVIQKHNKAALEVLKGPAFQKVYADTGSEFAGDTPENYAAFIALEDAKWRKIARQTGATLD